MVNDILKTKAKEIELLEFDKKSDKELIENLQKFSEDEIKGSIVYLIKHALYNKKFELLDILYNYLDDKDIIRNRNLECFIEDYESLNILKDVIDISYLDFMIVKKLKEKDDKRGLELCNIYFKDKLDSVDDKWIVNSINDSDNRFTKVIKIDDKSKEIIEYLIKTYNISRHDLFDKIFKDLINSDYNIEKTGRKYSRTTFIKTDSCIQDDIKAFKKKYGISFNDIINEFLVQYRDEIEKKLKEGR